MNDTHIPYENPVLHAALDALAQETGINIRLLKENYRQNNRLYDALLTLTATNTNYTAEIKRWAANTNFGALVAQLNELPDKPLLIADYVNPNMAARLKELNLQFIDTMGNAYLEDGNLFIYIKGNKKTGKGHGQPLPDRENIPAIANEGRAFEPTGLKVIFALLCRFDLVDAPYREIAETAGVALGTVGWVINGLKAGGYLIDKKKKGGRQIRNKEKLIDKWADLYTMKLRPKLEMGQFYQRGPFPFNIADYGARWGGETAGQAFTGHLIPEDLTVYMPRENLKKFLLDARLVKNTTAVDKYTQTLYLYEKFWDKRLEDDILDHGAQEPTVPPLLAYADLLATGDPRNIETARMIRDQYLRPDR